MGNNILEGPCCSTEPKECQVYAEISRNESLTERIGSRVTDLSGRLSAVMRDLGEEKGCAPPGEHMYRVPLADRLSHHGDELALIGDALDSILQRLEL